MMPPIDRVKTLLLCAFLVCGPPCGLRPAYAEMTVPVELQVDLLKRVVRFERGFTGRIGEQVRVLLVVRGGNGDSERVAGQIERSLSGAKEIAGKPVKVTAHRFVSSAALKRAVIEGNIHLIYLPTGCEAEVGPIAAALVGVPAITIATDGELVDRGAVLGFELVSARPKIALNLAQAKRQGLDFNSDLFRLVRVVK